MTNRLIKWNRLSGQMTCLLAACSLFCACKDDYLLDDEKPADLSTSVYQSLQDRGNFNNYLKLLADKDLNEGLATPMQEVLNRTGSKTVFTADDDAWERFFAHNKTLPAKNPWSNATSFENLSLAQKRLLIHSSMLNNAIVMENLANSQSTGNDAPVRGEFMRRNTDYEATDSVSFLTCDELPHTYSTTDKDYWKAYRENGKGMWLATDGTESMMVTFTNEHMKKNGITDDDFKKFMGVERSINDVYIYDAKLMEKDGKCENGFLNVTEKPLVPLSNMAEIIRTNGKTNIFNHMMDRFSAPIYSAELTDYFRQNQKGFSASDTVFVKRYFSDNSVGVKKWNQEPGPNGELQPYMPYKADADLDPETRDSVAKGTIPSLKFDPGWNAYISDDYKSNPDRGQHCDMAAMFVANDDALRNYFTNGGGKQFIKTFGDPTTYTLVNDSIIFNNGDEDMIKNIDMIPLDRVQQLINLIMQRSFVGSVPSKMTKLRDDALEQLFVAEDIANIDTCIIGCNGAVYIMKNVYGPADFTSVTSPAVISKTNTIMYWAIYDEENMSLNYYAYLKAMQSKFTFFLPSDSAMQYYYDPTSFRSTKPRVIAFEYKASKGDVLPIKAKLYQYGEGQKTDWKNTGKIETTEMKGDAIDKEDILNRFKDILESHTIVHDGTNDIKGVDEYFLSKNGNTIKVVRDEKNHIIEAKGAYQIETERQVQESGNYVEEHPGVLTCKVTEAFDSLKNGHTYVINAPLIPTYRSVYSVLTENGKTEKMDVDEQYVTTPYAAFYNLTQGVNDTIIVGCGLIDSRLNKNQQETQMKKFRIFVSNKQKNGTTNIYCLDKNITFFNNYHYTAFIPNNEAIEEAIENGLPTWESIREDYMKHRKCWDAEADTAVWDLVWNDTKMAYDTVMVEDQPGGKDLRTMADTLRIQAKITFLTNFIRYHFADNTIFADHSAVNERTLGEMVTSCYDKESGLFVKLHVNREATGRDEEPIMTIRDNTSYSEGTPGKNVITAPFMGTKDVKNILTRDMVFNKTPDGAMRGVTLKSSSTAVVHSIDGVLNHTKVENGKYDDIFNVPSNARKYMKRFAIEK